MESRRINLERIKKEYFQPNKADLAVIPEILKNPTSLGKLSRIFNEAIPQDKFQRLLEKAASWAKSVESMGPEWQENYIKNADEFKLSSPFGDSENLNPWVFSSTIPLDKQKALSSILKEIFEEINGLVQ